MNSRLPTSWRDHDYYAIIGVPATASTEQITQAYHRLARTTHPDTDPDNPNAADRFRLLADAHIVLTDPVNRAAYDRARSAIADQAAMTRSDTPRRHPPVTIASGSHRPRPAGATVQPGPVNWTPAPRPPRRREPW
jgi:curved DNA-binding protein CbpA